MLEIYSLHSTNRLQRILSQPLILATIATASLISGTFSFNSQVVAQTLKVDDTELINYAKAVLKIEPVRQQAFEEIKKILVNQEIPQVICNNSASINALPGETRNIAVNYCKNSQQIVEKFISVERFNKITSDSQNDDNLKGQIYKILLHLQTGSPSKTSK